MGRDSSCGRRGGAGGWLGKRGVGQDHADSACNPFVKRWSSRSNNKTLRKNGRFFEIQRVEKGLRFF
jgi:hypothetical protein